MAQFNPDVGDAVKFLPQDATGEVKEQRWSCRTALVSILMGCVFGIALEKSGVYRPEIILDQFIFTKWTMFKTFMTAVATSVFVQAFLSTIGVWKPAFRATRSEFVCGDCSCGNVRGVASTVVGSTILGIGMAFGGSCPGTVFAQLGAGMWEAWMTILGGLLAAICYGWFAPKLNAFIYWLPIKYSTVDSLLGVRYWMVAIPLFLVVGGIVALIESQRYWLVDTPNPTNKDVSFLREDYWPPEVGGAMIGLLQLPAITFVVATLGSSSSFMVLVTAFLRCFCRVEVQDKAGFKPFAGATWWWQVVYLIGAVGGSCLSATTAGHYGEVKALAWWQHFIGGILIITGSRLAGGCTSGHGISGVSQLVTNSMIAVPFIFGGGIATAFFVKAVCPHLWWGHFN
eukprot:TRINITY_DN68183_c5_g9_i1.p1 TRINITY_DN68183_c5_g9~~TRINITY_DN68183_c5_g9_i1.p1  ORF type:complete len:442 (-),score=38.94 TRINITY_DN68183_c5_g9_i1:267-1463(-)